MNYEYIFDGINVIVKSTFAVIMLFGLTKLMGKKQISQLNLFDYIVGITMGNIAGALSIDNNISYIHGILGFAVWGLWAVLTSFFSLKNNRARRLLEGTSTVLIKNGKIIEKNLKDERFHINDLQEELRLKGAFDIKDVSFAVLETNGQLSILMKPEKQPVTFEALNLKVPQQGLCINIIVDGKMLNYNLQLLNLDETWLKNKLQKQHKKLEDVFLAYLDAQGMLTIIEKDKSI